MAKKSSIQKNLHRKSLAEKYNKKRDNLKSILNSTAATMEEKCDAMVRLAKMPRNSSPTRYRNRCELTGRPRGVNRKFRLSRIMLRELFNSRYLPGVRKASW